MRKIFTSAIAATLATALWTSSATTAPLDTLLGEKRVLILFDQSRSSASLDRQVDWLRERRPDVADRDLIVLVNAGSQNTAVAIGYTSLPAGTARALKRDFKPAPRGMTMVLVGKDGGEKQRWNVTTDPQQIFDIIDAMPMRQREIKEGS